MYGCNNTYFKHYFIASYGMQLTYYIHTGLSFNQKQFTG